MAYFIILNSTNCRVIDNQNGLVYHLSMKIYYKLKTNNYDLLKKQHSKRI